MVGQHVMQTRRVIMTRGRLPSRASGWHSEFGTNGTNTDERQERKPSNGVQAYVAQRI